MSRLRTTHHQFSTRKLVLLLLAAAALWFAATAATAATIRIISPANEETIHDNSGRVSVSVEAELRARQVIRLLLDGAPAAPDGDSMDFSLEGIERGEHVLEAMIIDDEDRIIAVSPMVKFYAWQASVNLPPRKKNVKPPQQVPPTPAAPLPSHPKK